MIIDAHVHVFDRIWGYGRRGESRAVGGGVVRFATGEKMRILPEEIQGDAFTAQELLRRMDEAGIDKAILLQAGLYGFHNEYAHECAERFPDRLIAAYTFDPYAGAAKEILARIGSLGGRILKFELSYGAGLAGIHPYLRLNGAEMEPIYAFAADVGGTVVFDIGSPGTSSYRLDDLREVIRGHPGVKFVVCHVLAPDGTRDGAWERELSSLVAGNVWFDISALPWNIREAYPFPSSLRHAERAGAVVGTDRLIWGSDVPLLLTIMTYRQNYDYLYGSKIFDKKDLAGILGENAVRAYSLDR